MGKHISDFDLLRDKKILSILDGDSEFGFLKIEGKDSDIKISMPYLSGPTLCDISNHFGLPATYAWNGGGQSRWAYLDDLMKYCIKNSRGSDLLTYLFSKSQFVDKLQGHTPEVIEYAHAQIVDIVIKQINGIDGIIKRLYEDNLSGKLTDERFTKMSVDYEREQTELTDSIADLRQTIEQGHQQEDNTKQFLKLVKSYTVPDKLTPAMLHALVDKIVVHAPDKSTGHRRQQIDIYYNFVGQFDLSHETATRQTAKGMA